jgi:hypothetical protein
VPDPILMAASVVVAAIVSAGLLLIGGWPWRAPNDSRLEAGWVIGQGIGWGAGCWVLGIRPHWPIQQDLDRLLVVVLPLVMLVEIAAAYVKQPRWLIWLARLLAAAGTARILLHGTSYLTGAIEDGAWSAPQTWSILGTMAFTLALVWFLLALLLRQAPGLSLWGCLAGTSAGAGLTVMLSGYATGGQVGLPLAGALLGSAAAALLLPRSSRDQPPLGLAIVGLFSILVIGRFFGELTWGHAVLLFLAPLLGWAPELPQLRRLRPWSRGLLRVFVVGLLVVGVLVHARQQFLEAFQVSSEIGTDEAAMPDNPDAGR